MFYPCLFIDISFFYSCRLSLQTLPWFTPSEHALLWGFCVPGISTGSGISGHLGQHMVHKTILSFNGITIISCWVLHHVELNSATTQEFLSLAGLPGLLLIKSSAPKIPGVPVYPAEEINAAFTLLIDTDKTFSTDIPKTIPSLCKHLCTYHQILLFSFPHGSIKRGQAHTEI